MVWTLNHWIDGSPVTPGSGRYEVRASPKSGEPVCRVAEGDKADVDRAVAAAIAAQPAWARTPAAARGRVLIEVARGIRACAHALTDEEVAETGKLGATAAAEVEGAAQYFEYYGEVINAFGGDTIDLGAGMHSFTRNEPFGVVGVITPWNLPVNQAARAGAPAIAAGNALVLKPSSLTSTTSIRIAELARTAGVPDGVWNVVLGSGSTTGRLLARHPGIRKVAFTGSVEVGKELAHLAADRLIPLTLELGGKNANVVFSDADLDAAARASVNGFTSNAGQVCSACTRILVQREIHDAFAQRLKSAAEEHRPDETLSPVINDSQYEIVRRYLSIAEAEGATPITGGSTAADRLASSGHRLHIPPTVYTNAESSMRIAQEEVFGPVVVVIPFDGEEDAVELANDSPYGLVAGVWTRDISRALRVAARLEAGQVFVNSWWSGGVQTPFGGFKQSGYGREKGIEALRHYTQTKTVTVSIMPD